MLRVLGCMLFALATTAGEAEALGPGSVDRTFGDSGSVRTALTGDDGQFSCCGTRLPAPTVSRPDGSIVVGGSVRDDNGAPAMAMQAFDERGRVEASFAQDGLAVVQLGSAEEGSGVRALTHLDGGGVIAAGSSGSALTVMRLNADGQVVWTAVHRLEAGSGEQFPPRWRVTKAVAVDASGDVVIAGGATVPGDSLQRVTMAAARLDGATGSLDTSLAGVGFVVEPPADPPCTGSFSAANAVVLGEDGSITLAGENEKCSAGVTAIPGALLTRYGAAGDVEVRVTPSTGGIVLSGIHALLPGPDGGLIASGLSHPAAAVAGLTGNGDSLGPPTPLSRRRSADQVAALLPDGAKRVLAAVALQDARGRVARLTRDLTLDRSFHSTGIAASRVASPAGLARQPTGRIIVSGTTGTGPAHGVAIAGLHGGTTMGVVRLGRRAALSRRGAAVSLRCTGPALAPGCAGVATVRGHRRRYRVRQGRRSTIRIPLPARVSRTLRRGAGVAVRVTNPPARPLTEFLRIRR